MTPREQKTADYLFAALSENPYYETHPEEGRYRYAHSLRVAEIGRKIAEAEGFDKETLTLSCLLHDIAYRRFLSPEELKEHGRIGAEMIAPFLASLKLPDETIARIRHGVAIHVDFHSDEPELDDALTRSVAEADNIDRIGPITLCRDIQSVALWEMTGAALAEYCEKQLAMYTRFSAWRMSTDTAQGMWGARLARRVDFYRTLSEQALSELS